MRAGDGGGGGASSQLISGVKYENGNNFGREIKREPFRGGGRPNTKLMSLFVNSPKWRAKVARERARKRLEQRPAKATESDTQQLACQRRRR